MRTVIAEMLLFLDVDSILFVCSILYFIDQPEARTLLRETELHNKTRATGTLNETTKLAC